MPAESSRNTSHIPRNCSNHAATNRMRDTTVTIKCGKWVRRGVSKTENGHIHMFHTLRSSNTNSEPYYNHFSPKTFHGYDKSPPKSPSDIRKLTVSDFQTLSLLAPMPAPQPPFFSILHQKLGSIKSGRGEKSVIS